MDKPVIVGNVITIPSSDEFLVDVDSFLEGTLRGCGVDESLIADIAISVSELVNNAIFHGNQGQREQSVKVVVNCGGKKVTVSIHDRGSGYDPSNIANPIADENLLKEVGRGLFIVKSLMDSVETKPSGDGSVTTIVKNL